MKLRMSRNDVFPRFEGCLNATFRKAVLPRQPADWVAKQ